MINFFRKTREKLADDNKPIKYMRFAFGEILLVVIGKKTYSHKIKSNELYIFFGFNI